MPVFAARRLATSARKNEPRGVTLFAVPKGFTGHTATIQRNALTSWTKLPSRPRIILLGEEEGVAQIADEFGLQFIPNIDRNEFGTPLVNEVFGTAERATTTPLLMYVNADIILTDDVMGAVARVPFEQFLLTGRRWDVAVRDLLDFAAGWQNRLKHVAITQGELHGPTGLDYFVFRRGLWKELPPFALGRTVWDNYLVYSARTHGLPVIDATSTITAIHQNHSYEHLSKKIQLEKRGEETFWKGAEADANMELAGGPKSLLDVRDATWLLDPKGLRRAWGPQYLRRRINFQLDQHLPGIAQRLRRRRFRRLT